MLSPLRARTALLLLFAFAGLLGSLVAPGLAAAAGKLRLPTVYPLPFSSNPSSNITDLKSFVDFARLVRDDDRVYLAFFYDSLDINSVRLGATMEEVAVLLQGFVDVVGIDIREPNAQWLLNAWNVQVVPNIRGVPPRRHARASLGDAHPINNVGGIKQPVEFTGREVTPEAIKKFALSQLTVQPFIEKVDDKSKERLLSAISRPHSTIVLLFTDKEATSQLYRAVATHFFQRAAFLEAFKGKSPALVKHFNVKRFPTLLLFPSTAAATTDGTGNVRVYNGKLALADIESFIAEATVTREEKIEQMRANEEKQIALAKQRAVQPVLQIRSIEDWMSLVLGAKSTVAVLFTDPAAEEAKQQLAVLAAVKRGLTSPKGKSTSAVGAFFVVDATVQEDVAKFFGKHTLAASGSALVFISPRKSASSVYVGAFDGSSITAFIKNSIGRGAKPFDVAALPNFVDESLQ